MHIPTGNTHSQENQTRTENKNCPGVEKSKNENRIKKQQTKTAPSTHAVKKKVGPHAPKKKQKQIFSYTIPKCQSPVHPN